MFMEYENLCKQIFDIDKKIRFAAVYSEKTGKIAGGMRDGIKTLTPEPVTTLSVEQSFMRWQTRLEMNEWIGMPKYALAEYDKIKRFTFHIDDKKLLLVSTELDISNDFLIKEVRKLF